MANPNDQNITELPIKTNTGVASTDYMLGIDSAEGYQILVRDVAKYIVENYNGSTLAGSAQSPKSAINALQGKLDRYIIIYNATYSVSGLTYNSPSISQAIDAIAGKGTGRYFVECRNSASYSDSYSALTTLNCTLIIDVLSSNYINVFGLAVASENGTTLFRAKSNGNWGNWVKQPTRTEITELNSKLAVNVTAAANVVIDVNKSYKVGKMLFLSVKGHVTAEISNGNIFTVDSSATLDPIEYTLFCGIGTAWSVTSIGYLYNNRQIFSARVPNGQYFHICAALPIA